MSFDRRYKRTDLFLVRVWTQDPGDHTEPTLTEDDTAAWHGRVQRVVDGEMHEFDNWDALVAALRAMITTASQMQALDDSSELIHLESQESSDPKGEAR